MFIEAATQLKDDPDGVYMLGEVNTMFHEKLGKHFQVRGLPTLLIFSPAKDYIPVTFQKNRTTFDIVTEIELASGLISRELTKYEDFEYRMARRDENIILGIFKNKKHPLFAEMKALKEDFDFVRIYYTFSYDEFTKKLNLPYAQSANL
jgi:hypothetical protein